MNENMIYILIIFIAYFAYKKYMQYKVLKLVPELLKKGGLIIDVRTEDEFNLAHKDGSINIPLNKLNSSTDKLDKTKPIIVCCASGSRSGIAKHTLKAQGFKDVHNAGTWKALRKF
ncbi:rhodanese-like domain-containing protein [Arcobacter roscoffensis]|uniref:Rhodanese-like domain-containing protein n=1 Tax=Arcobacter roscoffensis TaxID=2961520 RepID=A0ABY5E642_9BACT|nr:rhodanese-like domain-containing protein [Arcobacter roscoffensis]UTJ07636.1 rhodanese-like domain-containing protein [Arcobacter roscoffensis]